MKYTVLMSVYAKEKAQYLHQSLTSMFAQTLLPEEIVLVCDGSLPEDLEDVIASFVQKYQQTFRVVRLEKQNGLANALNEGLLYCRSEYIVRMDSDDISIPARCETLLHYMIENNLEVCGSYVQEFMETPECLMSVRQVPCTLPEIIRYASKRNPFNHPSVAFCKSSVQKVGGYPIMAGFEDYLLWLILLQQGVPMGNIAQSLVHMRVNENFYQRRSGITYFKQTICFLRTAVRIGAIGKARGVVNLIQRALVCILPAAWCRALYNRILRGRI